MFLDTTTISDSTLSSSASTQQTTTPTAPASTINTTTLNTSSTNLDNSNKQQPLVDEPISNSQVEELGASSSLSSHNLNRETDASIETIRNNTIQSIWRIKSSWIISASVSAFWATLSFINHFIELSSGSSILQLLPSWCENFFRSLFLEPQQQLNQQQQQQPDNYNQLVWRETSMISFNENHHHHNYNINQQRQSGTLSLLDNNFSVGKINSNYLSAVNRARKWSEEAAFVLLKDIRERHGQHNNSCWASCNSSYGSSILYNNNNNSSSSHIYCNRLLSDMDLQHRGRFAQRADSDYNKHQQQRRASTTAAGSLSTPLTLPLHSIACPQGPSYSDALQIHRHVNVFDNCEKVPTSNAARKEHEVRRSLFGGSGGGGSSGSSSSSAQQQYQRTAETSSDFQGQQGACCKSLQADTIGSQRASVLEEDEHDGFIQQHKYHNKQQQQQLQHQQQQRNEQKPLAAEHRLGLSRVLLGMQNSNKRNTTNLDEEEQDYEGFCALHTNRRSEDTSDNRLISPLGSKYRLGGPERDLFRYGELSGDQQQQQHQDVHRSNNNHQFIVDYKNDNNNHVALEQCSTERSSPSSLVLVSKSTLNNLTEQIAFSMNKMKDLEEKVRVIPELQRRLHNVITSDTNAAIAATTSSNSCLSAADRVVDSSSLRIRDSREQFNYTFDNNNSDRQHHHHHNHHTASNQHLTSSIRRNSGNNIFTTRQSSAILNDDTTPYKTMFSSSLRQQQQQQPYGGSMRYSPGHFRASNLLPSSQAAAAAAAAASHHDHDQQSSNSNNNLGRASSFSITSSPYNNSTSQRYFDKLASNRIGSGNNNHCYSRQSLDVHNHRSLGMGTTASLNSSNNKLLGPSLSSLQTKVEYEDLINDLISLSYSVNYLSSSTSGNSAHSSSHQSSSSGNHSQVNKEEEEEETQKQKQQQQQQKQPHGNKLESLDAIRTSKTKRQYIHPSQSQSPHSHSNSPQKSNRNIVNNSSSASPTQLSNNNHSNNLTYHHLNNNQNSSMNHIISSTNQQHATRDTANNNNNLTSYLARNFNHASGGSLSLQTTPVKTHLDCGCQSFKEHLRYNSISREQRLNGAKSHQVISTAATITPSSNSTSNNVSPQPPQSAHAAATAAAAAVASRHRADASTNTDLSMNDVLTKSELNKLVDDIRKTSNDFSHNKFSSPSNSQISQIEGQNLNNNNNNETRNVSNSSPISATSSSGSATGPNSSSQPESRSISSGDERFGDGDDGEQIDDEQLSDDDDENEVGLKSNSSASAKDISDRDYEEEEEEEEDDEEEDLKESGEFLSQDTDDQEDSSKNPSIINNATEEKFNQIEAEDENEEEDDDDDDEIEVNLNSIDGAAEEAYSLGSSYQDPSDFEEYCAYGESLDRRTKDFLSQTTKIPNDLRFALIRLNDSIKKELPFNQIESSSNCIDVIRREWFEVAASKDSQAIKTKLYVDFFESFTKQLLNIVVNLTDKAGNTAMHYAASHFRLDIIDILLGTKVCDINCRNKAGYTPIMLLALAELEKPYEQEVARHLFSIGDVNIKARSSGQTALMLAASHGRVATCKLLLECGADPSLRDYDGSTALMCGSELGNEAVVRCLLAHKLTDPNATDNDGLDALTIAMNNGHKSIGLILYAAKNVPRMTRSAIQQSKSPSVSGNNVNSRLLGGSNYLGASLRRSRGKSAVNHVKRADSLMGQRHSVTPRHCLDV